MSQISLIKRSFFLYIILICLSFFLRLFPFLHLEIQLKKVLGQNKSQINGQLKNMQDNTAQLSKTLPANLWITLESNYDTIKVYQDRVEPDTIITYTIQFGNKGTQQADSVDLICLPPNVGRAFGAVRYSFWVSQDEKIFSEQINGPQIFPPNAEYERTYLDSVRWFMPVMPPGSSGRIVIRLTIDVSQILVSKNLTTQVALRRRGIDIIEPAAYAPLDIRCEVYPKLIIDKEVEPHTIMPSQEFTITIRYKNTINRDVTNVKIEDILKVLPLGNNILDIVDVNNIQYSGDLVSEPEDKAAFPNLVWNIGTLSDTDWHFIQITIPLKPYNDFRNLISGVNLHVHDVVSIKEDNDQHDDDDSQYPFIILKDLSPIELTPKIFGTKASPDFPIFIYSEIKNIGHTRVFEEFSVQLLIDGEDKGDKRQITDGLDADDHIPISWLINGFQPGQYKISIHVDLPDNVVEEVDELNNERETTFTVEFESYNVEINHITWKDAITIGGEKPLFPDTILSQIMVIDTNFHYIDNLAKSLENIDFTNNWSSRDDLVLGGQYQLHEIWNPLNEVDEEIPTNLENPTLPDYKITWIDSRVDIPISIALVMDRGLPEDLFKVVVDSMGAFINTFINKKRPVDKMAFISFNKEVDDPIPLTGDKDALFVLLDIVGKLERGDISDQAVFAAIEKAIEILKDIDVHGRKMILLCTNSSDMTGASLEGLIDKAYNDDESLPIFIFSIGNFEGEDQLKLLADTTGGVMMKESEAELHKFMAYDLSMFLEMFQNYYVLSYTTPNSTEDGKWRNLNVTLNYPLFEIQQERDTGRYKAPLFGVDLKIDKKVEGYDSLRTTEYDTLYYASISDTLYYILTYRNNSTQQAINVVISDTIPDKYTNLVPDDEHEPEINGNVLEWKLPNLNPNDYGKIKYTLETDPDSIILGGVPLNNYVGIHQADAMTEDANLEDNFDNIRIFIPRENSPDPTIIALPPIINSGELVEHVIIETFSMLYNWEIKVTLADGTPANLTFRSQARDRLKLEPGDTLDAGYLLQQYTTKRTSQREEKIIFVLEGKYIDGTPVEVDTFVIVKGFLNFFLNQNVFKPGIDDRIRYHFSIPGPMNVKIKVYNIAGELVNRLLDEDLDEGITYTPENNYDLTTWDGIDKQGNRLGSGVYIFIFEADGKQIQRKLAVIR